VGNIRFLGILTKKWDGAGTYGLVLYKLRVIMLDRLGVNPSSVNTQLFIVSLS